MLKRVVLVRWVEKSRTGMNRPALLALALVAIAVGVKSCDAEHARENSLERIQTKPDLELLSYEFRFSITGDPSPTDGMLVAGQVRNNTARRLRYVHITFNIYDDQGEIIDNLTASINDLDPYATWKFWTNHERNYHAAKARLAELSAYR